MITNKEVYAVFNKIPKGISKWKTEIGVGPANMFDIEVFYDNKQRFFRHSSVSVDIRHQGEKIFTRFEYPDLENIVEHMVHYINTWLERQQQAQLSSEVLEI